MIIARNTITCKKWINKTKYCNCELKIEKEEAATAIEEFFSNYQHKVKFHEGKFVECRQRNSQEFEINILNILKGLLLWLSPYLISVTCFQGVASDTLKFW